MISFSEQTFGGGFRAWRSDRRVSGRDGAHGAKGGGPVPGGRAVAWIAQQSTHLRLITC